MANVRAFRSGLWSDTNPATSPWGTGGSLYAPAAGDDVYSNTYTIHVDTNVTVNSVTNGSASSRLWKDGATTTAASGGTFNLYNGVTLVGNCTGGFAGFATGAITLSGTNSSTFIGISRGTSNTDGGNGILFTGSGQLVITGSIYGGFMSGANNARGVQMTGNGQLIVTGNVFGGTGTYPTGNNTAGVGVGSGSSILIVGNIQSGNSGVICPAIVDGTTGSNNITIIGNVIATSATNAFVSSNANAINKISGNIINHPNGTAAVYAARYIVDPIPTNSIIQYSNVNMFTTDSLSAFSMPPVSAVRSGVSFANNTLTGTCKVPSVNSVNIGVPVDNTVGTALLTPSTLFDVSVASLTASDSLGARLKNSATVQSVGSIITSFTN